MKSLITLLFLCAAIITCNAQQDPVYAQYMFNPVIINPGYTGINNHLVGTAGYRTQWTGLEGQPRTFNASVHATVVDNKLGVGFMVLQDKAGNVAITEAAVNVAYKMELENQVISFGMQAGMQGFQTDYGALNIHDTGDPAFEGAGQDTKINIGAGVVMKNEKYFVGLSIPRLLPSTFNSDGQKFELYQQHYYLAGAYNIYLNDRFDLRPSVLMRATKGAPLSADLGLNLYIHRNHGIGFFTRNTKTYGILLQTLLMEKYRIGYAYEMPTSRSVGNPFNTHEISIGIITDLFSFHERHVPTF